MPQRHAGSGCPEHDQDKSRYRRQAAAAGNELTLDPNNAVAPFNNLSVRIAIQHAINIR